MIREKIKKDLKRAIEKSLKIKGKEIYLEHPENPEFGDYASNFALVKFKEIKSKMPNLTNPLDLAKKIIENFPKKDYLEKVEVFAPGFINFYLKDKIFCSNLKKILRGKEKYGSSKIGRRKTIIIDYSAPNIAKPFSVGHLRSTIIGQALYNIYEFLGYKVIGDNHIGDWGTQYGKLIYAIKKWGNEKEIEKDPIRKLHGLYVRFHEEAEKDPQLEDEGRKWFKKLEKGDREAERIWKKCVDWSLKEFDRIYKILDIKIDLTLGESFYVPMLKDVIKEALKKRVAKKSKGAIIIEFPKEKLPPLMIQKSDGATLYPTRDLATIKYRRKKFKPHKIIYEVGADQSLYFKQMFLAAELLGWGRRENYFHVAHGLILLPTGRMRTRKGKIVLLENVLNGAIKRAREIIEKNPDLTEREKDEIARTVGIGAVKYNDLSQHYSKNIVFDWNKMLNLQGNSAPYLQYTNARAQSILRKTKEKIEGLDEKILKEKEELQLSKFLYSFPEVIEKAAKNYSPNLICNYLFELAQKFNIFYERLPVLKAKNENLRKTRLALVKATSQILKNGLNLLGISAPERM